MTQLKSLTFAPLQKASSADPVIHRRNKLIVRLQQQVQLAQDPNFSLTLTEAEVIEAEAELKALRRHALEVVDPEAES
jgi:hypothetical protein